MCTLTWLFNSDNSGYSLLFNRDELKTRKRAIPPQLNQHPNGVTYISPIDADAGGTWLMVNEFGLTVCLLNDYSAPEPTANAIKSRGEVVAALAACESIAEVSERLSMMKLSCYKGFEIVAFQNEVQHWRWNTFKLVQLDAIMPITSSSYETERVQRIRSEFFQGLKNTDQLSTLMHFHGCHIDDELHEVDSKPIAAHSVCMHRSYAETVSQCLVQVNTSQISVVYTDGSPCQTSAGKPLILTRLAVA